MCRRAEAGDMLAPDPLRPGFSSVLLQRLPNGLGPNPLVEIKAPAASSDYEIEVETVLQLKPGADGKPRQETETLAFDPADPEHKIHWGSISLPMAPAPPPRK